MKKKAMITSLLIAAGIVIAVAAVADIGLNAANTKAEEQVRSELDHAIGQLPPQTDLAYGSVNVQAERGRIEISDVQLQTDGHTFSADKMSIRLPRSEALAVARSPEEAILTDVTLEVTGLKNALAEGGTSGSHDKIKLQLKGSIPFQLLYDASDASIVDSDLALTYAALHGSGSSVTTEGYGELRLGSQTIEFNGDITVAGLTEAEATGNLLPLLKKIDSFSLQLSDLAMDLTEEARRVERIELESMLGPMPMLDDPENWAFESLSLKGVMTENGLELSQAAGKSNLVTFEGSFATELSPELEPQPPLKLDLSVADFHDDLRPILEVLAWQATLTDLPEGNSFTFSLFIADDSSQPVITLE